jgi:AraC family transcriptional regulator
MSAILSNSPRLLSEGSWPGLELRIKDQDISALTTWRIAQARHTLVVHLDGPIRRLETELDGAGAVLHPPLAGEVWAIPAEVRYASLAQGGTVRYAELFIEAALPRVAPRAGHYDEFLWHAVERLGQLVGEPDDLAGLAAHALSQAIYWHACREYGGREPVLRPSRRGLSRGQVKRLLEFIEENLQASIHLHDLAGVAGVTVHELLRAFRAAFGTTPAQYVLDQRLGRARWMLRTTRFDITRIALETGFASHAHLTTQFRKRTGTTPSAFRAIS